MNFLTVFGIFIGRDLCGILNDEICAIFCDLFESVCKSTLRAFTIHILPTHLPTYTLAHLSITIHVTTPQIMQSRVIFKSSFLRISHPKGRHKPPLLSSITLVVRKLLPPFGFCTQWQLARAQSQFFAICFR